jgi:hypothetical protein
MGLKRGYLLGNRIANETCSKHLQERFVLFQRSAMVKLSQPLLPHPLAVRREKLGQLCRKG